MATSLGSRIKSAWNAFFKREPYYPNYGAGYSYRPFHNRMTQGRDRTIVTSVYNRIAMDVAQINIRHARLDGSGNYIGEIKSPLDECLNLSANIDQTGRAFIQDIVLSMFDEGNIAIVPIDCSANPETTSSYEIYSMRTGKILEWYPYHVRLEVYNERTGKREEITKRKDAVAIVENPLYSVMNETGSIVRRLTRKMAILDQIDENNVSGKLDMIIQLPYVVKTDAKRQEAEKRRKMIEDQLASSKLGIAYADGTERITQLNRPLENNMLAEIQYLTNLFMSQLGITQEIMNGTASEEAMLNYQTRTVEPIISAIADSMKRVFLSKTARSQGQTIKYFLDPFKLVPVTKIADIGDRLTRNEIVTSNEMRQILGMIPSDDPNADVLRNKNIAANVGEQPAIDQATMDQSSGLPLSRDEYVDIGRRFVEGLGDV